MIRQIGICLLAAALPIFASAAPVSIDGTLGAEWSGVPSVHVNYNVAAPVSNFSTPTNSSNNVGYDIYVRKDANYLYVGLKTSGPAVDSTLTFSNLYFALLYGAAYTPSVIGFQVTNDLAFDAGTGDHFSDTAANLIQSSVFTGTAAEPDVIEVAFDLSIFTDNALGVSHFTGLPAGEAPFGILLLMSQSFGYSVAGGTDAYGPTRLGFVGLADTQAVPEPDSIALLGLGLAGLALVRKRRRIA